ncbi:hypothetical protein TNCV_3593771 [Trichonephila clavipes]|nr:hypothetical protein TNCV_3593771 [Trichonephila clavipes]
MPAFTITSTSIILTTAKCILFNSFSFHIVDYHSGRPLAFHIFNRATVSESQPTIPVFNSPVHSTVKDQVKCIARSKDLLLPKKTFLLKRKKPPYPAPNTSNPASDIQTSRAFATTRALKENAKKKQNLEIEIKMALHRPRKSFPIQDTSDEEMLEYDAEEYVLNEIPLPNQYSHH